MPGNILVSVREFFGLPSSSPSSPLSLKVSMGKIEYQTSDKEEFSFCSDFHSPLTTLRDNLIVALLDADGKEISRAGVETKSIVERGLWDDLFPLEGGGHVQMNLQFVLNEDERNRIRMMRESALKMKHDELLKHSIHSPKSDTTAGGNVALSLDLSNEASAVSVKEEASKACLVSNPVIFSEVEKSGSESIEGIHPDQNQSAPDQYEELLLAMPASQGVDVHLTEVSHREPVEENESKTLPAESPTRAICSVGVLSVESGLDVAATSNSISHDLEETMAHSHQKRTQPGKTRSNVRKMISAFESSLSQQDMWSQVKPPPTEFQSSQSITEAPLKSRHLNKGKKRITKAEDSISGRPTNPFFAEELKHGPAYFRKREEQISLLGHKSSQDSWQLEELNNKKFQIIGTMPSLENKFKAVHKEVDKEEEKCHQDSMQTSTFETPTVSGRMLDKHSGRHPHNLFIDKQDSCSNPVIEESRRGIQTKNVQKMDGEGASRHRLESVEYNVNKHSLFESSGVWIFPVEARRLCVTTGGTKMIDLMGGYSMEPEVHQGKLNLSTRDIVEEHSVDAGIAVKVNKDEKTCHKIRNSKHERSENIETSGGPVGQVVKVAIMIGFGLLVLLTRQKNNRNRR
ncbi:uncharacterized protein LOC121250617 isoform X4 [Juglans microcarpa x Juglans regia]|uniref:uncharacterized protein LOC121250617 isoform X4 n=1 Tax=Juglans microcarpa x Juglans regia TaxID=2249226 RepID=UPI001B7DCEFE|nr:uncharacterized protein LOC121250617 isoform X4 [Juglans microcarpa x Juglans regia]